MPCEENFIDEESLTPLPFLCPPVVHTLQLLETVLTSYTSLRPLLPADLFQSFWMQLQELLVPEMEGAFVASILHYCCVLLEYAKEDAAYVLPTLASILPHFITDPIEEARAEW